MMRGKNSLFILFIILLSTSCHNNSYILQYSPLAGTDTKQQFGFEMDARQKLRGQEFTTRNKLDLTINHIVKSSTDTGALLECEYLNAVMEVDLGVAKMSFTSGGGDSTASLQNLNPLLSALLYKPMQVSINKRGKVLGVSGFSDIEGGMGSIINANKIVKTQMLDMMQKSFGDKALAGMYGYFTHIYPVHPVHVGDTWTIVRASTIGINLNLTGVYKLEKIDGKKGVISCEGIVESDPENNETTVNGINSLALLRGTYTGRFEFDTNTGYVNAGKIVQQIEGAVQVLHTNNDERIDMDFKGTITLTQNIL